MTNKERVKAILNYENYDRMPAVHFGFWDETLELWHKQGHITEEEARGWGDSNEYDRSIGEKLGFDFNWSPDYHPNTALFPAFESKVVKDLGNGTRHVLNHEGVILLEKDDAGSIPAEIDHLLCDRESWEEHYLPKLRYSAERINPEAAKKIIETHSQDPVGLQVGSLYGNIRNWLGVVGSSYLLVDDEELLDEIIDTNADLCYNVTRTLLDTGVTFDYAHYWEDICFKNGPLINPSVFREKVAPHYRRIADLLNSHGISIISLDCDGCIDALLPIWLESGVNTMFPIEYGTWEASIAPWRQTYGPELRGVGGMNKNVFALDKAAVDQEIERLKALIALGGYIPCPDHRIPPDAKWENVVYYTEQLKKIN